jgi:hypothetical protein
MFERYTENARRVVFFARYEASNYGSSSIDTEHLLLGVMREGQALVRQFLPVSVTLSSVREDVEKAITRGKRIPTSVEVPLSGKAKEALLLASEEVERLAREYIDVEHILIGILMVEGSLAARILTERGVKLEVLRKQLATTRTALTPTVTIVKRSISDPVDRIHPILDTIKSNNAAELGPLFAANAQVIDSKGRRWKGHEEIEKEAGRIFFDYSKKTVTAHLESVDMGPGQTFAASVLWEGVIDQGVHTKSIHRMTIVIGMEENDWVVLFIQVTPVAPLQGSPGRL